MVGILDLQLPENIARSGMGNTSDILIFLRLNSQILLIDEPWLKEIDHDL